MKNLFYVLYFSLCFVACSSSDDSSDDNDDNPEAGDYSLRVNGDGFNDELYQFASDNIENSDIGLKFTSSDSGNNNLYFVLPSPVTEGTQYTIAPYNINNSSVSSFSIVSSGIYLSESGTMFITDIITEGDCTIYVGSIRVDYRRQDNTPGALNLQGSFRAATSNCE